MTLDELALPSLRADIDCSKVAGAVAASNPMLSEKEADILNLIQAVVRQYFTDYSGFRSPRACRPHMVPITCAAIDKAGEHFCVGSYDKTMTIHSASGERVAVCRGHQGGITVVSYRQPQEDLIATGSIDRSVRLWGARYGEERACLVGHGGEITHLYYGGLLISAATDGTARLWDPHVGAASRVMDEHLRAVTGLDVAGRLVLTSALDATVRIWDVNDSGPAQCFSRRGPVCWGFFGSQDGSDVVAVTEGELAVIDRRAGRDRTRFRLKGALAAAASALGRTAAVGCEDGTVTIFDCAEDVQTVAKGHSAPVNTLAFARAGRRLISGSSDGTCRLWNGLGDCLETMEFGRDAVVAAMFNYKGNAFVTAGRDGFARVWSSTGQDCLVPTREVPKVAQLGMADPVTLAVAIQRLTTL